MLVEAALAATIAHWMTQAHYPEPVKAALLHRIHIESRFQPNAVSPGGRYHCLIQWDQTRYRQLLHFAQHRPSRVNPCPAWDRQVAFMNQELKTRYRGVWRANRANAYHVVTAVYFGGVE